MESYRNDRSSVTINGFELAKFLPEDVPLKDRLTPEILRRLLQLVPRATLAQYSYKLRVEYSIVASTTAVCRAFKRAGLGPQSSTEEKKPTPLTVIRTVFYTTNILNTSIASDTCCANREGQMRGN